MSKELPPKLADAAVRTQGLANHRVLGGPYRVARWFVAGSPDPFFEHAEWQQATVVEGHNDATRYRTMHGNDEAGRLPRSWRRAAVIGATVTELDQIKGQEGAQGQMALGYYDGEQTRVAVPSRGLSHFRMNEETLALGALRQGQQPLEATMGVWYPEDARLVVPETFQVVGELLPRAVLREYYPAVPLV